MLQEGCSAGGLSLRPAPALVCALALLAPALAAPLAGAFHDPAPLLDERVIDGPFWFVYRIRVAEAGTTFSYEIAPPESMLREQSGYGLWTMRVGEEKPDFFVVATGGTRITEADVRKEEPAPVDAQAGPVAPNVGTTYGFAITHRDEAPGDYWLVIVNTAPWMTRATLRLYGTAGVTLEATAQGNDGSLLRETDFASERPYHHVRAGVHTFTAQAHSVRDARVALDVEHRLFGIFKASGPGEKRDISRIQPDGAEVRPSVTPTMVLSGETGGRHTFRIDAWEVPPRAALGHDAHIVLLYADVRLPEAP